jgi:hypothetical protein
VFHLPALILRELVDGDDEGVDFDGRARGYQT